MLDALLVWAALFPIRFEGKAVPFGLGRRLMAGSITAILLVVHLPICSLCFLSLAFNPSCTVDKLVGTWSVQAAVQRDLAVFGEWSSISEIPTS